MFEEIVTSDIVNPTLCALTSQKLTSLPHTWLRGRYAMHAAATVHKRLAAVAVMSRELGTLSVTAPPMKSATTCTASPTDLSSVVRVVEKPCQYGQKLHIGVLQVLLPCP